MQLLPIFGVTALFLVLAVRLHRSASCTGGSERWLSAFFGVIALALPLRTIAADVGTEVSGAAALGNAFAHVLISISIVCFTIFVWRVFRFQDAWAKYLALGMIGMQGVCLIALFAFGGHRNESHDTVLAINLSRALPYAWGFGESYRYQRMMARRQKLGMGDVVVTNRFRLFSIWTGALCFLPIAVAVLRIYLRHIGLEGGMASAPSHGAIMNLVRACVLASGLVASGAMWLSFFPPKGYLARLARQRAES